MWSITAIYLNISCFWMTSNKSFQVIHASTNRRFRSWSKVSLRILGEGHGSTATKCTTLSRRFYDYNTKHSATSRTTILWQLSHSRHSTMTIKILCHWRCNIIVNQHQTLFKQMMNFRHDYFMMRALCSSNYYYYYYGRRVHENQILNVVCCQATMVMVDIHVVYTFHQTLTIFSNSQA